MNGNGYHPDPEQKANENQKAGYEYGYRGYEMA